MSQRTTLADILSRMDRWDSIVGEEEQFKVRDLDSAIRKLRRRTVMAWMIQKSTLRVFKDVLEYPLASDHDELAFLDNSNKEKFASKPRFRFTTMKEFYEDPDYRNDLAEIWDNNERVLGVRYNPNNVSSVRLNNAETVGDWTLSGDAGTKALDSVIFKEGNGSIKVPITLSASTATVKNDLTSDQTDANYKQKYHFKWVYLDAVPTSISLRYHVSASVYLETTGITTQFAGQSLKADQWNLVAHDLNAATATGSLGATPTFTYEEIDLIGAATGTYFVDASYVRQWELLDYYYYSKFMIATVGETTGDQEYFFNSSGVYSTDSQLVGDSEWADAIMFEALLETAINTENGILINQFKGDRDNAMKELGLKYPNLVPIAVTKKWRFDTNPGHHGTGKNYV